MEAHDPNLSHAYRLAAHPEPSPALDARILEAARQAVAPLPARTHARWFAWAVPVSTTAVLVLGITLLFQVQNQAPELMESPTANLDMADAGPAPMPQPAEPTLSSRPPPYPQAQVPLAMEQAADGAESGEPLDRMAASAPPSPPDDQPPAVAAAPEPRPQPFPAQDAAQASAGIPSAGSLAAPPQARRAAPAGEGLATTDEALSRRKAMASEPAGPDQRVETIRRLVREGRRDEARQALEKLRQDYPWFVLPEDLKGL